MHTWRNPSDTIGRYFAFIAANGHTSARSSRSPPDSRRCTSSAPPGPANAA